MFHIIGVCSAKLRSVSLSQTIYCAKIICCKNSALTACGGAERRGRTGDKGLEFARVLVRGGGIGGESARHEQQVHHRPVHRQRHAGGERGRGETTPRPAIDCCVTVRY